MQVVILAGGLGTRLRPITETIPKPMVDVNGKPFLEYQINMVKKYGFKDILLLVGYLGEQIENYFGDGSDFGVNISYNYEKELLGTGGALKLAEEKIDDEFILIYCDSYLDYDYNNLVDFSSKNNYDLVLTSYDNKDNTDVLNNLQVENGTVLQYKKGVVDEKLNYVEAGVLFIKKKVLDNIEKNKVISLEEAIFPKLISEGKLGSYTVSQRFYDIGTFDRLNIFSSLK